jgi:hypothetical protein
MSRPDFGVLFRRPIFPVVGFSDHRLFSALDLKTLVVILVRFDLSSGEDIVKLVDSTGEEFWYSRKQRVLSPGFLGKRLTKRQIIDLYNSHIRSDRRYSARSLSNTRLPEIVAEISDLIQSLYSTPRNVEQHPPVLTNLHTMGDIGQNSCRKPTDAP